MSSRASLSTLALFVAFASAAAAVAAVAAVAAPCTGESAPEPEVVVTLQDDRIDESSGAVVRGDRLLTVNDSGDGPYLYEVDLRSGETVGVTTFGGEEPEDVEALAAGTGDAVWVGDIGDNRRSRSSVTVHRFVPVPGGGEVSATRFELVYPDRPHDAEALLVHPRTGRLLVVTKSLTRGGVVFRAPRRLVPDGENRWARIGTVPGLVTGGTFLPGGSRLLLRTYGNAAVYSYPGLEQLAAFALPRQEQGEAVAVGRDGRIYLTSEGEGSDVLVMELPEPDASSGAGGPAQERQGERRQPSSRYDPQPWMGLGPARLGLVVLVSAVAVALLRVLVRAARRRGPPTQ